MQVNKEEKTVPSLARIVGEINRKYGAGTLVSASAKEELNISRIPTGVLGLDKALKGGMPKARMVELYGAPSAGKSLISLLTIKEAQKMGLNNCVYFDVEKSFDNEWTASLGVDVNKLIVTQLTLGEDIIDTMGKILESEPDIIVVDSVAGMLMKPELEEDAEQQFMALKARLMSRGLAKLNSLNKKTLIIWINQLRNTMAMYGAKTTTPGGNALKHYASMRLLIAKDSTPITASGNKTDENVIGQVVNWRVTKSKVSQTDLRGSFRYLYSGKIEE